MVIPEAESPGPARKRPRLSLKHAARGNFVRKPVNFKTSLTPLTDLPVTGSGDMDQSPAVKHKTSCKEENEKFDTEKAASILPTSPASDSQECSGSESPVVPAVASLINLGNTCFLNSILQVLRYTPGFLDGLYRLNTEVWNFQKHDEQNTSRESFPTTFQLVRQLFHLYQGMTNQEENHSNVATADGVSMASRPEKVLNTIRELNPMFEGNLQHDAQEFMRCILCYMQDASKEVVKLKKGISQLNCDNSEESHTSVTPLSKKSPRKLTPVRSSPRKASVCTTQEFRSARQIDLSDKVQPIITNKESFSPNSKLRIGLDGDNQLGASGTCKLLSMSNGLEPTNVVGACVCSPSKTMKCHSIQLNGTLCEPRLIEGDTPETEMTPTISPTCNSGIVLKSPIKHSHLSSVLPSPSKQPVTLGEGSVSPSLEESLGNYNLSLGRGTKGCDSQAEGDACAAKGPVTNNCAADMFASPVTRSRSATNNAAHQTSKGKQTTQDNHSHDRRRPNRGGGRKVHSTVTVIENNVDEEQNKTKTGRNQPSILSMLNRKSSKRLGMRGRVSNSGNVPEENRVSNSGNVPEEKETDKNQCKGQLLDEVDRGLVSNKSVQLDDSEEAKGQEPRETKPPLDLLQSIDLDELKGHDNQSEACTGEQDNHMEWSQVNVQTESTYALNQPRVSLENCDHVCDSPKKSVSACEAERALSPSKKALLLRKIVDSGVAQVKLNFDNKFLGTGLAVSSVHFSPARRKEERKARGMDFVEDLFMGKMMLRTKCLECEQSKERIEEFHDIAVPVRKEETADDTDTEEEEDADTENSCLKKLMEAFTEVEHLRGENKYYCEPCMRYVEAQRSLHYEVLPDILTLQLKRFQASSSLFGYISKINDHISIPLSLPCLMYKCPSPCCRPDHRYILYGIVTHAGVTLTSGHYLAYVRVPSQPCRHSKSGIFFNTSVKNQGIIDGHHKSYPGKGDNPLFPDVPIQTRANEWLECDDESIRTYDEDRFRELLQGKGGSLLGTPYVLFYHRALYDMC